MLNKKGFSLVELIIYIALLSIVISGAVLFAWDIIYGRVRSRIQLEVNQNLRLSSKRMMFEIRNADDIRNVKSDSVCLESASFNLLSFYLDNNRLMIGWGNRCNNPPNRYPITSNMVNVENLEFADLTTTDDSSKNVRFVITIASNSDRKEWQKSQTYTSSVELRSN